MGNLGVEVNAVHEDVALGDLLERAALGRLGHIPLEDVLVRDAGLQGHVDGAATTPTKGTDDDDPR